MDYVGIDLHKTSSQVCILSEDGELTERRIKSTRASFDEVFAGRPPARILVEASTESEWVACHLEALGHEGSQLRPDVRYPRQEDQDRQAGREGTVRGVPPGCLPPRTPHLRASGRSSSLGPPWCVPARRYLADRLPSATRGLPHRHRRLY